MQECNGVFFFPTPVKVFAIVLCRVWGSIGAILSECGVLTLDPDKVSIEGKAHLDTMQAVAIPSAGGRHWKLNPNEMCTSDCPIEP